MNCHQVLSGACNSGDQCFAVGSVEGIPFTVSITVKDFPLLIVMSRDLGCSVSEVVIEKLCP